MSPADLYPHVVRMDKKWRKRFSDDDLQNEAKEFSYALQPYRVRALEMGVDALIREEAHYPTPGKLRQYVSEAESRLPRGKLAGADLPTGLCPGCRTYVQRRDSYRRPVRRADVVIGVVMVEDVKEGIPLVAQWRDMCDCQWGYFLRTKPDVELSVMGQDDPFVRDELRRRAAIGKPISRLARIVQPVVKLLAQPQEATP